MATYNDSIDDLGQRYFAAFQSLINALSNLAESYNGQPMPMWAFGHENVDVGWLENALLDLWYHNGQAGNESRAHVGLVGATPRQIELVKAVNESKHVLQATGIKLKDREPSKFLDVKGRIGSERNKIQPSLNDSGLGRLHLKQAWRRLPVANEPVKRVHFSWYSSGRTIKRMTIGEADEALCRLDVEAPHIRIQRQKLASLPSGELLAQVRPQAALMRANITYLIPLPTLKLHQAMNVGMPLFVPLSPGEALPVHNEPCPEPPAERSWPKRRDAQLMDEPFLPSIHVHRYRSAD